MFTGLLSVVLNLAANLINAALVRWYDGFHHVNIGSLVLLWASRPRLAWVVGLLVNLEKNYQMYRNLGASAILAEVILQAVGSVYIGITANWAQWHHYYLADHLANVPHGSDAHLMYAGALLWLITVGGAVFITFLTFTPAGVLLWSGLKVAGRVLLKIFKCIWKWTKKGTRWTWRWFRIGVATIYLKIWIRSAFLQRISGVPEVPEHPIWALEHREDQDNSDSRTSSLSSHKGFDIDERFLRNLTLIVFLMVFRS